MLTLFAPEIGTQSEKKPRSWGLTAILLLSTTFLYSWEIYNQASHTNVINNQAKTNTTPIAATQGYPPPHFESKYWYAWQPPKQELSQVSDPKIRDKHEKMDTHTVTLPVLPPGKYLLVIGSFGDSEQKYPVEISTEASPTSKISFAKNATVFPQHHSVFAAKRQSSNDWHQLQKISEHRFQHSSSFKNTTPRNTTPSNSQEAIKQISFEQFYFPSQKNSVENRRFVLPAFSKRPPAKATQTVSSTVTSSRSRIVIQSQKIHGQSDLNIWLDQALPANARYDKLAMLLAQSFKQRVAPWYRLHLRDLQPQPVQLVITPYLENFGSKTEPVKMCVAVSQEAGPGLMSGQSSNTIYVHANLDQLLLDDQNSSIAVATLLAHELLHLCSLNAMPDSADQERILHEWIFEGWAHAAEMACTGSESNLTNRINVFTSTPERSPLRVESSASIGRYRNAGARGASASFFSFLRHTYPEITWEQRLRFSLTPTGIELLHQKSLPDLFQSWTCFEAEKKLQIHQHSPCILCLTNPIDATKARFMLQGSTAKPVLINLSSPENATRRHRRIKIRICSESQPQLTLVKYQ